MRPSPLNLLFTHSLAMCVAVGALAGMGVAFVKLQEHGVLIADWAVVFWLAIAVVPTVLIGAIISCIFLGPLIAQVGLYVQGGPFVVGDSVLVLTGEHKGVVTQVYAVWAERLEVRLDLGKEAEVKFTDVKSMLEICRVRSDQMR